MNKRQARLFDQEKIQKTMNVFKGQMDLTRWHPNQKKLFEDGDTS